jgi:protein O-mannosyl-transferase
MNFKNILKYNRREIIITILLVLVTAAAYRQIRNFNFINYDDNRYITDNYHIRKGLSLDNIIGAFTTTQVSYWHPLTWISHMLDVELFGMNAGMHHLSGIQSKH